MKYKYIDSEKLIAEIKRRKEHLEKGSGHPEVMKRVEGTISAYDSILSFVTSLQEEQPMPDSTKLIELWHEDKEMLKEKDFRDDQWRLAFNAFLCGFGRGIAVKQKQTVEEPTCKTCGFYENNCPFIRDKFIPYPSRVCKDYTYSVMKAQEQSEVDIEKEYAEFVDADPVYSKLVNGVVGRAIARHFAKWGAKHARKDAKY